MKAGYPILQRTICVLIRHSNGHHFMPRWFLLQNCSAQPHTHTLTLILLRMWHARPAFLLYFVCRNPVCTVYSWCSKNTSINICTITYETTYCNPRWTHLIVVSLISEKITDKCVAAKTVFFVFTHCCWSWPCQH